MAGSRGEKFKVLLVDDDTDFLGIMGQIIESWGYDVLRSSDAAGAVTAVKSGRPDVAVLDYVMPDTDGITLLGRIRDFNKEIPVIMFTANPDTEAIKESAGMDIMAFVPKLSPYLDTKKSLKAALNMAIRRTEK